MKTPSATVLLDQINRWVEVESKTEDRDAVNRVMDLANAACAKVGMRRERITGRDGYGDCLVAFPEGDDGSTPGILVLAHLDTVHPAGTLKANPIRTEGDRAYGPGIFDMKGGAVLGIVAAGLAREEGATPLPVRLLFVSEEEVGSPMSRAIIEDQARFAKYALVVEPGRSLGKVVVRRKGTIRMDIQAHGRPSHAGVEHQAGRSAILEIARQTIALEAMTDYTRGITVNVGVIAGGSASNVVPAECQAAIDGRAETIAEAENLIERIRSLRPHDEDVRLTITGGMGRPPFEESPQGQALFDHARAEAAAIGIELEPVGTGGGSDGNFTAAKGVPTLDGLGVVGAGAHTLDEHLLVSSLEPRCALLARLYRSLR